MPFGHVFFRKLLQNGEVEDCESFTSGACIEAFFHLPNGNHII